MSLKKMSDELAVEVLGLVRGGNLLYDTNGNRLCLTSDSPDGGAFTKISGNGYSDITLNIDSWTAPLARQISNAVDLPFPAANGIDDGSILWSIRGVAIERSDGTPLYSATLAQGQSLTHGDEFAFNTTNAKLTIAMTLKPAVLGDALAHGILAATLKGQDMGTVPFLMLSLLENPPVAGVANSVLASIPPLQVPATAAQWFAPTLADRKTYNLLELRFEAMTADAPKIGGFQLTDDENNLWWQGAVNPAKVAYEGNVLKILPEGIVLEI